MRRVANANSWAETLLSVLGSLVVCARRWFLALNHLTAAVLSKDIRRENTCNCKWFLKQWQHSNGANWLHSTGAVSTCVARPQLKEAKKWFAWKCAGFRAQLSCLLGKGTPRSRGTWAQRSMGGPWDVRSHQPSLAEQGRRHLMSPEGFRAMKSLSHQGKGMKIP